MQAENSRQLQGDLQFVREVEIEIMTRRKEHQKTDPVREFPLVLDENTHNGSGMETEDSTGRFLASRVYSRWKWAARFGLMVVPMLVLLSGGLVLFLSPKRFKSTALVEFQNARSPQESAKMCKSLAILNRVIDEFDLMGRLQVDREEVWKILAETVEVKVIPDTRLIEITATFANNELAKDIADEIPRYLAKYENEQVQAAITEKMVKLDDLILNARDTAAEKAVEVSKIEKIQGQDGPENGATRKLERARRASLLADADVERLLVLRADAKTSSLNSEPRMIVHTKPYISGTSWSTSSMGSNPDELSDLALEALAAGLIVALLLPYLCELAFPVQSNRPMPLDIVYDM
ncbi:MAG: hypothetical protein ORN51_04980 [Akkermansiaceae bacterium]|nr:hypothetical protein [Akkermansiaceae bacterium]